MHSFNTKTLRSAIWKIEQILNQSHGNSFSETLLWESTQAKNSELSVIQKYYSLGIIMWMSPEILWAMGPNYLSFSAMSQ